MMNYKKTLVWLVLVIGLAGGLASPAWADQNQNNQLNGLAGRLQALQQQILALQNRLQSLLAQLANPTSTPPSWSGHRSDNNGDDGDQNDRDNQDKHPGRPERPARPMMPGSWRWPWPGQSSTTPITVAPSISQTRVVTRETSADVFWQTDQLTTGQLTYDSINLPSASSRTSQASQLAWQHQVHLSGLTPNTTYYYQINASNQANLNTGSNVQTFTTRPGPTSNDSTAPQLVFISATNLTANSAKIIWVTNEAADSELWLATTTPVATTTAPTLQNSVLSFYHELSVTGLTANTTYYYVAKSRDASGNLGISTEASFSTTP